jgi:hypothetical protein
VFALVVREIIFQQGLYHWDKNNDSGLLPLSHAISLTHFAGDAHLMMKKCFDKLIVMLTFAEFLKFERVSALFKHSKQVLLVCQEGGRQDKTVHYALNLCQRIGADIFYFSIPQKPEKAARRQYFDALVRYVKKQTSITCTVMSQSDDLDMINQWAVSGCPLIIITV